MLNYSNGRFVQYLETDCIEGVIAIVNLSTKSVYVDFINKKLSPDEMKHVIAIYKTLLKKYVDEGVQYNSLNFWKSASATFEKQHFQKSHYFLQCAKCRSWRQIAPTLSIDENYKKYELEGNWVCSIYPNGNFE